MTKPSLNDGVPDQVRDYILKAAGSDCLGDLMEKISIKSKSDDAASRPGTSRSHYRSGAHIEERAIQHHRNIDGTVGHTQSAPYDHILACDLSAMFHRVGLGTDIVDLFLETHFSLASAEAIQDCLAADLPFEVMLDRLMTIGMAAMEALFLLALDSYSTTMQSFTM